MNDLTIVLPCYNPPPDWHVNIIQHHQSLTKLLGFPPQLIVVNDGSKHIDNSALLILQKEITAFLWESYADNHGKGFALRTGISLTKTPFTIYTDIDFPYQEKSLADVYRQLQNGMDIVIGTKSKEYYSDIPKARKLISKTLRWMIRQFFAMPVTDTQCGLKGFNEAGKKVFLSTTIDRYLFDLEFVYKAYKYKPALKIIPIIATLRDGIVFRKMNMKLLAEEMKDFLKLALFKK